MQGNVFCLVTIFKFKQMREAVEKSLLAHELSAIHELSPTLKKGKNGHKIDAYVLISQEVSE